MTTRSDTSTHDLAGSSQGLTRVDDAADVLSHPIWVIGVVAVSVVAVFAWIGLIGWALAVALIWMI
jgi:hypothetical protein